MKNRRNYYRTLYLQPDAPTAVIKASYRALMQGVGMHPDLGGDHERAAWINEAFDTLSDPAKRAQYDRQLTLKLRAQTEGQRASAEPAAPSSATAASRPSRSACSFCDAPCPPASESRPDAVCATCGSALCTANRYQEGTASRRAVERLPRDMPISFRVAGAPDREWNGTTEDISLNGMRFLSPVEIAPGARVQIDCDFCSAVGTVKSARRQQGRAPLGWHYGVEFTRLRIKRDHGGLVSTVA